MSRLSPDQVLALASDAAAVSAAQELGYPGKWVSTGTNESAVWGEARGSGKNPYQTAVDLNELAYNCSCPSRKIPCKHALGLMLRYAKHEVGSDEPPNWFQEWLNKRSDRSAF